MLQEWNNQVRPLLTNVNLEQVSKNAGLYLDVKNVDIFENELNEINKLNEPNDMN